MEISNIILNTITKYFSFITGLIHSLKPLLGPILGATIALFAIWFKQYLDKKSSLQNWLESTFINQTIDPLLLYLEFYKNYHMLHLFSKSDFEKMEVNEIKHEQLQNLSTILQSNLPTFLILNFRKFLKYSPSTQKMHEFTNGFAEYYNLLNPLLYQLKKDILKTKIRSKSEIYDFPLSKKTREHLTRIESWFDFKKRKVEEDIK